MYTHMYTYIHVFVCMYIFPFRERERERERERGGVPNYTHVCTLGYDSGYVHVGYRRALSLSLYIHIYTIHIRYGSGCV